MNQQIKQHSRPAVRRRTLWHRLALGVTPLLLALLAALALQQRHLMLATGWPCC
ncbi:hypothetical protein [Duganella fentianensis]|uniref:hypothetical protein n=1 Tax=Duganella fentianensis TaxID=2692177 RepID=UPI0032B28525